MLYLSPHIFVLIIGRADKNRTSSKVKIVNLSQLQ